MVGAIEHLYDSSPAFQADLWCVLHPLGRVISRVEEQRSGILRDNFWHLVFHLHDEIGYKESLGFLCDTWHMTRAVKATKKSNESVKAKAKKGMV